MWYIFINFFIEILKTFSSAFLISVADNISILNELKTGWGSVKNLGSVACWEDAFKATTIFNARFSSNSSSIVGFIKSVSKIVKLFLTLVELYQDWWWFVCGVVCDCSLHLARVFHCHSGALPPININKKEVTLTVTSSSALVQAVHFEARDSFRLVQCCTIKVRYTILPICCKICQLLANLTTLII